MKTSPLTIVTALALGLATGACGSSDTGEALPATAVDAGSTVATDAGSVATDAGSVATDAGSVATDAGSVATDAGSVATDAGSVATDAGSVATDAGSVATDAGSVATDAGSVATDAGSDGGAAVVTGIVCSNADALTPPIVATYTMTAAYANDYTTGTVCKFGAGVDRVFAIDVPAGKRLYSSVRGVGTYDPAISLADGSNACTATGMTCLAGDDTGVATSLNFVTRTNSDATSKRVFVIVDAFGTGTGDYDFRAVIGDALPGDTCATATPIQLSGGAATLAAQTVDLYENDYKTGSGCTGFGGGERVYRFDVPANTTVAIQATPDATFDVAVNVIEGAAGATPETACASSITCATGANVSAAGVAERAVYRNATSAAKTIFVTVEAATSTTVPGTFTLAVETLATPTGDTCATAPTATAGTLSNQSLLDYLNDYSSGTDCSGTGGPDRLYKVSVPAGKRLVAIVTPPVGNGTTSWDPSVNIQSAASCGVSPRTCLAGSDGGGTGSADTASWTNTGASAVDVYVVIETYTSTAPAQGAARSFDLALALTTPPTAGSDDVCVDSSTLIAANTTLTAQSLDGYANNYGTGAGVCATVSASNTGIDRAYRVSIGAGKTFTATLSPDSSWDPTLSLVLGMATACSAGILTCAAGEDGGYDGDPETLTYTNNTASAVDAFLIVDSWTPSVASAYAYGLSVTFTP